jgi:hypothetical protein
MTMIAYTLIAASPQQGGKKESTGLRLSRPAMRHAILEPVARPRSDARIAESGSATSSGAICQSGASTLASQR